MDITARQAFWFIVGFTLLFVFVILHEYPRSPFNAAALALVGCFVVVLIGRQAQ